MQGPKTRKAGVDRGADTLIFWTPMADGGIDMQQLQRVATAIRPHLASPSPDIAKIMAAILLAANVAHSSRAACRAVGVKESARDRVAQLAGVVGGVIAQTASDIATRDSGPANLNDSQGSNAESEHGDWLALTLPVSPPVWSKLSATC